MNYYFIINFLILAKMFTSLALSIKSKYHQNDNIDTLSISRRLRYDRDENDDDKVNDEYDYFYYEDDHGRRVYPRKHADVDDDELDNSDDHKEGVVTRVSIFEHRLRSALAQFKNELREELREDMRKVAMETYQELTSDEEGDSDSEDEHDQDDE